MSDRIHSVDISLYIASQVALSLTRTITGADPQITSAAAVTVSATRAALAAGRFACRDADAECMVYMRAATLMRSGLLGDVMGYGKTACMTGWGCSAELN